MKFLLFALLISSVLAVNYNEIISLQMPLHAVAVDDRNNQLFLASNEQIHISTFQGYFTKTINLPINVHVESLTFMPDFLGGTLAAKCNDSIVRLYDVTSGSYILNFSVPEDIRRIFYSNKPASLIFLSHRTVNQNYSTNILFYTPWGTLIKDIHVPFMISDFLVDSDSYYFDNFIGLDPATYIWSANFSGIQLQVNTTKVYFTFGLAVNTEYIAVCGSGLHLYKNDGSYVKKLRPTKHWDCSTPIFIGNTLVSYTNTCGIRNPTNIEFMDHNGNIINTLIFLERPICDLKRQMLTITKQGYIIARINDYLKIWEPVPVER